jgi:hypothetical protein
MSMHEAVPFSAMAIRVKKTSDLARLIWRQVEEFTSNISSGIAVEWKAVHIARVTVWDMPLSRRNWSFRILNF